MRIDFDKETGKRATAASAFSLVELLIGVFIAAIVYASVFCGVSTTFRMLNDTRENLRATQIMVSRLEGLRLEAWGPSPPTQLFNTNYVPLTFVEYFYPAGISSSGSNEGTYYAGALTITTNPPMNPAVSYGSSLALVTVSLTWTNGVTGVTNVHTRTMSTYIAQYGIQSYVWSP